MKHKQRINTCHYILYNVFASICLRHKRHCVSSMRIDLHCLTLIHRKIQCSNSELKNSKISPSRLQYRSIVYYSQWVLRSVAVIRCATRYECFLDALRMSNFHLINKDLCLCEISTDVNKLIYLRGVSRPREALMISVRSKIGHLTMV